ncbi:hypothetical protein FH972_021756 [Carpinus fangiana]|uniref:E2 ubiquitin-conjugating enzyme n=1 Tax=Carpinus fangiana TaxID=176857 RepID=A0A5N6KQ82_9ROSI|nr:hypothetical protein FH972_021756 [Carpinus fangiana]
MGSSGGGKRIARELGECTNDPPEGIRVQLVDDADVYRWDITMDGPEQSPYAGGHFKLQLRLPTEYPFKPPTINFATKIYHPNVSNDDKGSMCLGMLRSDQWKPPNKIVAVLNMVRNILIEPNIDDAVETGVAEQYKNARDEFVKTAREWTAKYASGK